MESPLTLLELSELKQPPKVSQSESLSHLYKLNRPSRFMLFLTPEQSDLLRSCLIPGESIVASVKLGSESQTLTFHVDSLTCPCCTQD